MLKAQESSVKEMFFNPRFNPNLPQFVILAGRVYNYPATFHHYLSNFLVYIILVATYIVIDDILKYLYY